MERPEIGYFGDDWFQILHQCPQKPGCLYCFVLLSFVLAFFYRHRATWQSQDLQVHLPAWKWQVKKKKKCFFLNSSNHSSQSMLLALLARPVLCALPRSKDKSTQGCHRPHLRWEAILEATVIGECPVLTTELIVRKRSFLVSEGSVKILLPGSQRNSQWEGKKADGHSIVADALWEIFIRLFLYGICAP